MPNTLLERHQLPPFSRIEPDHVVPAVTELIERNRRAIDHLLEDNDRYNWDNLLGPIEEMEDELARCWAPVGHLNGVLNSEALRTAYNACLPLLSEYSTWTCQHSALFAAYQQIADDPGFEDLDRARKKAVHNALRDFRLAGVALGEEQQREYAKLRQRLSELGSKFNENVLDATAGWTRQAEESELAGMPASAIASAAQAARQVGSQGCLITLDYPSVQPVLSHCENRELRREVYTAHCTRASDQGPCAGRWDNSELMVETLDLRQRLAALLGFDNYAEYSLATKMAQSTGEVLEFLTGLAGRCRAQARREYRELCEYASAEHGLDSLQAWDIAYYSEQLKQSRFRISQEEIRPYLPVPRVLAGLFEVARRLFDVEIEEQADFDSYHPDARLFNLSRNGELIARFYLDLFARPHKRGGAWMDDCRVRRETDGGLQVPVAYLVCNFTPPVGDRPALLSDTELTTLFHEFGHGLHHMLTRQTVAAVSGINGVAWDAVELPSQFLENWCWQREALAFISGHFETGEPLPDTLLERLLAARNFQSAMGLARQLEFALFDFRLHMQWQGGQMRQVQALLDAVRSDVAVMTPPAFNRFQHSFSHIFAGGYAAGYFSYKWAEVLSADAFSRFEEEGIFNPETGLAFRRHILEAGGSRDALELFTAFRGREPDPEALLRHSGIRPSAHEAVQNGKILGQSAM